MSSKTPANAPEIEYRFLRHQAPGVYRCIHANGTCALYRLGSKGGVVRIGPLSRWAGSRSNPSARCWSVSWSGGSKDGLSHVEAMSLARQKNRSGRVARVLCDGRMDYESTSRAHLEPGSVRTRVSAYGGRGSMTGRPIRGNPAKVVEVPIATIITRNKSLGGHFFDQDTMSFFKSKVHGTAYTGLGGTYFVTSEPVWGQDERSYGVHRFHAPSGRVETVTDVEDRRPTLQAAIKFAKVLAHHGWKEARINPTSVSCPRCRSTATVRKTGVSCYKCGFIRLQDRAKKVGNCSVCRRPVMDSEGYDQRGTGEVKHFLCNEDSFRGNPRRPAPGEALIVRRVAKEFAKLISEWLTPAELRSVNEMNAKSPGRKTCATHDFCDPNEAMSQAIEVVSGQPESRWAPTERRSWNRVWDRAWDAAKKAGFDPQKV